jgi:hypothetical protein
MKKYNSEPVVRLAESLSKAWVKYREFFGEEPHGTVKQLAAMIELCPEVKEYIRLFEKQREDLATYWARGAEPRKRDGKAKFQVGEQVIITNMSGRIVQIDGDIFVIKIGKTLPVRVFCYEEQFRREIGPRKGKRSRKSQR